MPKRSAEAAHDSATGRVPWVRPQFDVDEALIEDIRRALSSGRVTNDGPLLRSFEQRLADSLGVAGCVAASSGSAALFLAASALGLSGGEAVLPAFTYIATLNAVLQAGMEPIFCDIDPDTWTLDPAHLELLLDEHPSVRLVVPVNVFGVPPALPAIDSRLRGHGAKLVLDNAHGMGSEQEGKRYATEPLAQTFSFHATKVLPAVEGGAVASFDARFLAEVRRLRNHGLAADPLDSTPGYNAKMSELHAAVALRSLQRLPQVVAQRRQHAERLRRCITEDCAALFTVQQVPPGVRSNFQNLAVVCRGAGVEQVQAELDARGIETRRYFWPALHHLRMYRDRFRLPVTDTIAASVLCLPLHDQMDEAVLQQIEQALRQTAARLA